MDVESLRKSISDKTMKKKIAKNGSNRFLVTVNVLGSSGPIRFVVSEGDTVSEVIDAALKLYGREERLPQLGSDVNSFLLYLGNPGLDALNPSDLMGSMGMIRNFILCKKEGLPDKPITDKRINSWKSCLSSYRGLLAALYKNLC